MRALKAMFASGLTLLRAAEAAEMRERWSYVLMSEELRRVVEEPTKDATELFRRMTFDALISNLDDHPPNHAPIAKEREWQLSPAGELRDSGVHGLLIYCSDFRCSHSIAISGDRWPDEVRLSDIEPRFTAKSTARAARMSDPISIRKAPRCMRRRLVQFGGPCAD